MRINKPSRRFFTPSGVQSSSDLTQFASDLASDLDPRTPFHFKQIRRTRNPGLLWIRSMVPNLYFRKRQPFLAHNFKRKSTRYSILSLHVASLFSATLCCRSSKYFCQIKQFSLLSGPNVRPETTDRFWGNPRKTI